MTKEELLQTYFYIEDISGSENTVSITKSNVPAPTLNLEYSTDNKTWTTATMNTDTTPNTFTIPANGKLYLRGVNNSWGGTNIVYNNKITATGNHNVGGNIMSLLYGSEFITKTSFPTNNSNVLITLFYNNTNLVNAQDLQLPATTLAESCYKEMFNGCSSLVKAPELPATTLASTCYQYMFKGCSSLTTAPSILPATTLANGCYYYMFNSCTSLTTAPELPATTLANSCYQYMFQGCNKLNYIKADFINYSNNNGEFKNWVQGVSSTGTFIMNPEANYIPEQIRGVNGIPRGWNIKIGLGCIFMNLSDKVNYLRLYRNNENSTNINDINLTYNTGGSKWITIEDLSQPIEFKKQLSLRGINNSLEGYSFSCKELYSVNGNIMELLLGEEADTLGNVFPENSVNTFKSLFKNDKNLLSVGSKVLPSTSLVKGCYTKMFLGCSNMENCPDLPATEISEKCYVHMFTGCSKLQSVPNLPATNLTKYCYHGMFMDCDTLTTVSLPESYLEPNAYSNMFLGSENLNNVTVTYTNPIEDKSVYDGWLNGVSINGEFNYRSTTVQDSDIIKSIYNVPGTWDVTKTE